MSAPLLDVEIRFEQDIVLARGRIRQAAALLGFDPHDQARMGAAVSEIARNALQHGGGGRVTARLDAGDRGYEMAVLVEDRGPGIASPQATLDGSGGGLLAARRLMGDLHVDSSPGRGTRVRMARRLPRGVPPPERARLHQIARELGAQGQGDPYQEIRSQNAELVRALEIAAQKQEELVSLNRELDETNRGVLALYAELDEQAESLRKANALRGRVLSQVSHEFRTPLNAIASLARLLDEEADGPLTREQRIQVRHILTSGLELIDMVNDLLDLAKVDAGKLEARMAPVEVENLFAALRGMFRPLVPQDGAVSLVFEPVEGPVELTSDEGKIAQILRNLISNALKFTERGEVHVTAGQGPDGTAVFTVTDTGIGIEAADLARIFDEFTQVDQPLQRRVQGTGLGLPLSRRLATLLGGRIDVESVPGGGSTFRLLVPARLGLPAEAEAEGDGPRVLVVDDEPEGRDAVRRALAGMNARLLEAPTAAAALELAHRASPDVVVLDLGLPDAGGEDVLQALRADAATREIPVLVFTSRRIRPWDRERLREANAILSKDESDVRIRSAVESLWKEVEADR